MVRRRADAFDAMRLHRRCEQGLALIAVLWIVAALSILVTGLGQTVRQKAQAVGTTRQSIAAQALGDAAVHTALQRLAALPAPPDGLVLDRVEHGGVPIVVSVQPLDGLIDLNNAVVLFSTAAHGLYFWMQGSVTAGSVAIAARAARRPKTIGRITPVPPETKRPHMPPTHSPAVPATRTR